MPRRRISTPRKESAEWLAYTFDADTPEGSIAALFPITIYGFGRDVVFELLKDGVVHAATVVDGEVVKIKMDAFTDDTTYHGGSGVVSIRPVLKSGEIDKIRSGSALVHMNWEIKDLKYGLYIETIRGVVGITVPKWVNDYKAYHTSRQFSNKLDVVETCGRTSYETGVDFYKRGGWLSSGFTGAFPTARFRCSDGLFTAQQIIDVTESESGGG